MARTGFGSRFLLGQRSSGRAGQLALTAFVLLLGLVFCAMGAGAGVQGLEEALDPGAPMYRLRRPASGRAFRRAVALRAESSGRPPICDVLHEHYVSGKNGGWRVDTRWSRGAGATVEGAGLRVAMSEPVVFDPFDALVVGADDEAWFRTVLAGVPDGGRLRAHCVASGQTVFVDGCVGPEGGQLTGCGDAPLTVTTGDGTAQPRIDAHASAVAGRLAGGAVSLVAVFAYLWWALRARPLAAALVRRAGPAPTFTAWPQVAGVVAAALGAALAQGLMVWPAAAGTAAARGRPGYLLGLLVCAAAGVLALVVRHRRNVLERAMAPVREAETVPLREARGGVVELAVRVRDDAPTEPGVLDPRPHAWVEVRVEETFMQGKQALTRPAARVYWPARIPVRDASGDGWIDPTHVELDLRSTARTYTSGIPGDVAPALARRGIGHLTPSATHRHWTVEESVLDPGEAVYALGQCRRVEDPKAAGSYRMDSTVAVVGGTAADQIILHAGDERSLLRSIGLERSYLDLLTAALAGVAVSLAVTMAALWAL